MASVFCNLLKMSEHKAIRLERCHESKWASSCSNIGLKLCNEWINASQVDRVKSPNWNNHVFPHQAVCW